MLADRPDDVEEQLDVRRLRASDRRALGDGRLVDADRRRRMHLLLTEAEREEQLRERTGGGYFDDVRQVTGVDPGRTGRGVDVGEEIRSLVLRERMICETDPGVPPSRRRLAKRADEVRDPLAVAQRLAPLFSPSLSGTISTTARRYLHSTRCPRRR